MRTAIRLMLNTGHPVYIFWGPEGLCFYNDAYLPSLGPERHPITLGRPAREVWDEIWPLIGDQLDQVMSGGGATWDENRLIPMTRSGVREEVYWTYSYGPIDDETAPSGIGGVLTLCTETTQLVLDARRLAESEARLQQALSAGRGVGTWDWDVQTDRVVADERFAQHYGVDPEWAKAGAPIAEFFAGIDPDHVGRVQANIEATLSTGKLFSQEYRLLMVDGTSRWVLAEGRCTMAADGTPLHFPGVSLDITDRKVAEIRLSELNDELERKVIERSLERGRTWQVSPEILGVLNAQGYFETSNPAWEHTLGWSEDEVGSRVFFDFIHPDDLATTQHAWADAIERGLPALNFENRYRRKAGGYRWLSWVAVPEGGKVYCSARDITEEKAQAEALAAAEDALRQSHKMEAVGQLTGGIAHDFNNLLAGISGSLELLDKRIAEGRLDAAGRYIEAARQSATRAAALTQRLLAFSRRQTLDPRPIDTNRLISGMDELIRRTTGPNIEVEVAVAIGLWPILVDPNQLENALLNLCINARDAMPDGGRLDVGSANTWLDAVAAKKYDLPPGQYVSLCVTDTGAGMTRDVMEHAFDPFFTTKPLGQGTGLGLSMIYGFVRQSGGQVHIDSEVGKGTTMCLYFPRHASDVVDAPAPEEPTGFDGGHGETVLVV
ncbi:MAG: PAS domain-containing protein, partial [bacterium]|nr:PAS domain-containing protein [bacterium]